MKKESNTSFSPIPVTLCSSLKLMCIRYGKNQNNFFPASQKLITMSTKRLSKDQKAISLQLHSDLAVIINTLTDSSRFRRTYVATWLCIAVACGRLDTCQKIIDNLEPKALRESLLYTYPALNASALAVACKAGNLAMIKLLIQAAHDLRSKAKGSKILFPSCVAQVALTNSHYNVLSYFLKEEKDIIDWNVPDTFLPNFLTSLLSKDQVELASIVLDMIPAQLVNLDNSHLLIACSKGLNTFVRRLLDKRAIVNRSVLTTACSGGKVAIVRAVAEDYILTNQQINTQTFTAMMTETITRGHLPVLNYLINKGAAVNVDTLHSACFHKHVNIIKFLLLYGVSYTTIRLYTVAHRKVLWSAIAELGFPMVVTSNSLCLPAVIDYDMDLNNQNNTSLDGVFTDYSLKENELRQYLSAGFDHSLLQNALALQLKGIYSIDEFFNHSSLIILALMEGLNLLDECFILNPVLADRMILTAQKLGKAKLAKRILKYYARLMSPPTIIA